MRTGTSAWLLTLLIASAAACGVASSADRGERDGGLPFAPPPTTQAPQADGSTEGDPFAATPDETAGLTNVSEDLGAILEKGALANACTALSSAPNDRAALLRCGKSMFFDESFQAAGVPKALVKFLIENFPDEIGPGLSKLGMVEDPRSADHLPLGLATSKPLGTNETLAFTCASCHFGKLPDGRYAVGAPNHAYEYGKHNLAMLVLPIVAISGKPEEHDPLAIAAIKPLIDKMAANPLLKLKLGLAMAPLAASAGGAPAFPVDAEKNYASWASGTMDFAIEPLPINDKIHTISKISALWGIPSPDDAAQSGMLNGMLGWTGSTHSVASFATDFVVIGGGDAAKWTPQKLRPLVAYVESLRAPENRASPPPADVEPGRKLFASKGCLSCHGGPRGSGKRVYTYDEIGTDRAMARWFDPDLTGTPCCGAKLVAGEPLTHGIKSPRLVGLWAQSRFLHNGAVKTLEELFCVDHPRGSVTAEPFGDGGHTFTCNGLSREEKTQLIAYLRAH